MKKVLFAIAIIGLVGCGKKDEAKPADTAPAVSSTTTTTTTTTAPANTATATATAPANTATATAKP